MKVPNQDALAYIEDSRTFYHNVVVESVRGCKDALRLGFKHTALSMLTNIEWETTEHEYPWTESYPATLA